MKSWKSNKENHEIKTQNESEIVKVKEAFLRLS